MSEKPISAVAVIGIDIGKNSFHVVGHDDRGYPVHDLSQFVTGRSDVLRPIFHFLWSSFMLILLRSGSPRLLLSSAMARWAMLAATALSSSVDRSASHGTRTDP
jgi:hypothetical protein